MRNTKTVFLTMLLFAAGILKSNAQMGMGKIEEIESLQERQLIVLIEEPREKMLKRLTKKPKLGTEADYKADLITYNANVKAVVEKFYPYTKKEVLYKTYSEIEKLKKSKSDAYAVLCCLSSEPSSFSSGLNYADGLYWEKDIKLDFEDRNDLMFTMMVVNLIEDFEKTPVFQTPLFDVFPTQAALAFGMQTTKNYFEMRIRMKKEGSSKKDEKATIEKKIAENAPKLKDRTLLVRSEWLDEELTKANFKNHYPFKYKICDRETMDKAIMSQDETYAYGVVLPYVVSGSRSNSVIYFQYIFDAKNSEMMAMVSPSTGSMMGAGFSGKAGNRNFTFKVMEKIRDQISGKQ
jgi:hypothetical protein